jgi:hypothetical protein
MPAEYFANACDLILQSGAFVPAADVACNTGKNQHRIDECGSSSCSVVGELDFFEKWDDVSTGDEADLALSSSPTASSVSPSGESQAHSTSLTSPTGSATSELPGTPTAEVHREDEAAGASAPCRCEKEEEEEEEEYHTARSDFDT